MIVEVDPIGAGNEQLEAARKILTYTQGQTFDDFMSDSKTVDAVARNFEVIGETASRLPVIIMKI
jgi:uncharacterized protein with HEPN domain